MHEFKYLSDADIEAIHSSTLRVLAETGVIITDPEAREILSSAGAKVENERVFLPASLVEEQVAKAGTQVTLRGRGGTTKTLGDGSIHWHNLGGARDIYDAGTGMRRNAVLQDLKDCTRLLDALDGVTTITPFFTPLDVPGHLMSLAMYRYAIPNTTKPLQGPGVQTAKEAQYAIRMAAVIGHPNEVFSLSISPVSPLNLSSDLAAAIIEVARQGVPFAPLPCPKAEFNSRSVQANARRPNFHRIRAIESLQRPRCRFCGRHASAGLMLSAEWEGEKSPGNQRITLRYPGFISFGEIRIPQHIHFSNKTDQHRS